MLFHRYSHGLFKKKRVVPDSNIINHGTYLAPNRCLEEFMFWGVLEIADIGEEKNDP